MRTITVYLTHKHFLYTSICKIKEQYYVPIFCKNNKSATASISGRFNPSEVFKY